MAKVSNVRWCVAKRIESAKSPITAALAARRTPRVALPKMEWEPVVRCCGWR